jgi:uncharacterized protein RhaS with RHS repeats
VIKPRFGGCSVRRYYDPSTGQFISVDPAVDQTEAPYAYVAGDPVNLLDPNGLGLGSWFESNVAGPVVGGTETFAGAWWEGAQQFVGAWWEGVTNHPVCVASAVIGGTAAAALVLIAPEILAGAAEDAGLTAADQEALDYATASNKLNHIFDAEHNLEPLVRQFGSREAVVQQFLQGLKGLTPQSGEFEETISVGGQSVTVRGAVVKGIVKIGTAFTP